MDRKDALHLIDALAPAAPTDPDATSETHEQCMMCTKCFINGLVPPDHFPQTPGLWSRPCPQCGEHAVWVTEVRERTDADTTNT